MDACSKVNGRRPVDGRHCGHCGRRRRGLPGAHRLVVTCVLRRARRKAAARVRQEAAPKKVMTPQHAQPYWEQNQKEVSRPSPQAVLLDTFCCCKPAASVVKSLWIQPCWEQNAKEVAACMRIVLEPPMSHTGMD